ncbi:glycerol-3-phosphate transporter [Clostridium botulinum]|uniref:Glycerol-3-phosphate transporter n=2 Tax=Clostridium botulinum TaxID=1491 RepID=A0A6G4ECM4_CLOBO|nr:glycerol-3-phosphate transporter [Clostridium botulinum]APH19855.1 glycerol-3-phosphate transporter [Clostridium botulinum]AUM90786.1 glycerol-3-phosphate transporter [Clostridium botulinum]AUN17166.1 glycerol-3-phosphate transporter [Clostridium botulinum]KEJ02199.1 sn-glycerol-3-phosphate transporter [Clostridium botulinum F 357]MBE1302535.1 glycerol-3-phosphate transporter [Clostridium botulinum]
MLKDLFKPASHIERMPKEKIDSAYRRYRIQVFISIYVGYLTYYFVRSNFSLAKVYLIQEGFTKTQLGFVASALGLAYGVSKFVMGNLSDRSNPRYFLAAGLILSGIVNLFFPMTKSITAMFVLMLLNGWFQGMGWPPCGRTMTHWFSDKERGVKMSIWNTAHNVGGGFIATVVLIGVSIFGSWKGAFYLPAVIAIVVGILFILFAKDTPQSVGLPPIEEYKNDYPEIQVEDREKELSGKEILFKYVLNNKYLWYIAIANIFVYLVRYGVINWVPTYLKEVKHFNPKDSSLAFALFEYAAIPGTIFVGWLSDKVFHGRRAPVGVFCMIGVTIATYIYWKSNSLIAINCALASIGALIYGPVMLIGVSALDLVPKKAAGTAAGFTGLFGYMGGQVLAEVAMGAVVDKFSWNGGFILLMISSVLAIVFLSFTWNTHDRSEKGPDKVAV